MSAADFSLRGHLQQAAGADGAGRPALPPQTLAGGHRPVAAADLPAQHVGRHPAGDTQHTEGEVPRQAAAVDPNHSHRPNTRYVKGRGKTVINNLISKVLFLNLGIIGDDVLQSTCMGLA